MSDQNALLTEKQREFLKASEEERKEDYTKQRRSYYRKEIRERVKCGLNDFSILFDNLDKTEREKVFRDLTTEDPDAIQAFPTTLYTKIIAFLYLGLSETWRTFDHVLRAGIRLGERHRNPPEMQEGRKELIVEYDGVRYVDVDQFDIDEVAEKLENRRIHDMTDGEIRAFMSYFSTAPAFDSEALREMMKEGILSPPNDDSQRGEVTPIAERESDRVTFSVKEGEEER